MCASSLLTGEGYVKNACMRTTNKARKLKVLFLSSCDPFDIFLIKEVMTGAADCVNVCGIIRAVHAPEVAQKNWQRCLQQPLHNMYGLLDRFYRAYRKEKNHRQACNLLFDKVEPELHTAIIDIPEYVINRPRSVEKIASFSPDIIILSGVPVPVPAVLSVPRFACLEVHEGIAPDYRGEHAQFWPLWLGDYENIGFTIHCFSKENQEGTPLVRGYPALSAEDTEFSIAMKSVRLSALLIREVLQNIQRDGKAPTSQRLYGEPAGQLIHHRDRKVWHDLAYALTRYLLGRHPPEQAQRIERFYGRKAFTVSVGAELVKRL